jgi:ferredoxin
MGNETFASFHAILLATGKETLASRGLTADALTNLTSRERVFACGSLFKEVKIPARAVASGRQAALFIDLHLKAIARPVPRKQYVSRLNRLEKFELDAIMDDANPAGPVTRVPGQTLTREQALEEQARCLNCDCCRAHTCRLREYATGHMENERRINSLKRNPLERLHYNHGIVHEPGKCVKCGICVRLSTCLGHQGGFVFLNRGYGTIIGVDQAPIPEEVLAACVDACPTGALYRRAERMDG